MAMKGTCCTNQCIYLTNSEPEEQKQIIVTTPKENGSARRHQSNTSSLKSNVESPYKVESGVALSPKNDREPTEPLFSSGCNFLSIVTSNA